MIEYHNESVETYLIISGREPYRAVSNKMISAVVQFDNDEYNKAFHWVNSGYKNEIIRISDCLKSRLIDNNHKSIIALNTDETIFILENMLLNEVFCLRDIPRLVSVLTLPIYKQKNG